MRSSQEDKRAHSRCLRGRDAVWLVESLGHVRFIHEGMLEESHCELHAKNVAHCVVEFGLCSLARVHNLLQVVVVDTADHVHVDAAEKSFARGGSAVIGNAMANKFADRIPIAYDQTAKAPLLSQDLFQSKRVRG